uniref:Uncharacterized protein n=1 Tax=Oryza nivara TaxID=4536 RepID=A0A0E0IXM4_ORYNI
MSWKDLPRDQWWKHLRKTATTSTKPPSKTIPGFTVEGCDLTEGKSTREFSVLTHATFILMAVISEPWVHVHAWVSLSAPLLMKCEFGQNRQKCMCDCKPSPYAVLLANSTGTVARSADNRVREGMAGETAVYSKQYSVLVSGE